MILELCDKNTTSLAPSTLLLTLSLSWTYLLRKGEEMRQTIAPSRCNNQSSEDKHSWKKQFSMKHCGNWKFDLPTTRQGFATRIFLTKSRKGPSICDIRIQGNTDHIFSDRNNKGFPPTQRQRTHLKLPPHFCLIKSIQYIFMYLYWSVCNEVI